MHGIHFKMLAVQAEKLASKWRNLECRLKQNQTLVENSDRLKGV